MWQTEPLAVLSQHKDSINSKTGEQEDRSDWYISVSLTYEQFKKKEQELKETVCVYVCAPYMRPRFPQEPTAASRFLGIWKDFKIIT